MVRRTDKVYYISVHGTVVNAQHAMATSKYALKPKARTLAKLNICQTDAYAYCIHA